MVWFYLALASTFIFAAQELLMRVLSIKTGSPRVFSTVFNLWGAAFAVLVFAMQKGSLAGLFHLTVWHYLLIASSIVLYGLYERFQFSARQGMDAATFAIVMRLQTVVAFVGAMVFLHEPFTLVKTAGVFLVVAASFLLVYKNPSFTYTPAFGYAILCSLMLGSTGFIDKPASAELPSSLYSFLMWIVPLVIIVYPGISPRDLKKEFRIGGWKVALAALLNVVGYIIYIDAISLAEASRINPIVATNSVLTVLGGIILLKERDHFWRKILAGAIAFLGVLLLA